MKMRSIKTMALWFTTAILSNSLGVFAHHSHHSHHNNHCHQDQCHHSPPCILPIPDPYAFINPAEAAFNTIVGDLNVIFVAESFAKNPPPGSPLSLQLGSLFAAEIGLFGAGAGSLEDAGNAITQILLTLGVPSSTVNMLEQQAEAFVAAALTYSAAVVSEPITTQQAALTNWNNQGSILASELASLSSGLDLAAIQNIIADLINAQSWAIQAYNFNPLLVPNTGYVGADPNFEAQMAAAVALTQRAHVDVTELARLIIGQLVRDFNHNVCPQSF
jgi:hypothetical protein